MVVQLAWQPKDFAFLIHKISILSKHFLINQALKSYELLIQHQKLSWQFGFLPSRVINYLKDSK